MLFFAITLLFLGLSNGITLKCTFGPSDWQTIGNVYACSAKVNQVIGERTVTGVSGTHWSGKTNDDVKAIQMDRQTLDFIPRDINKHFKNLQGLQMVDTTLKFISKFDLQQFPDLKHLDLRRNQLEVIDGDLFSFTTKIKTIILVNNKITNVGLNLLSNLKDLGRVFFNDNPCIHASAESPSAILDLSRKLAQTCPTANVIVKRIADVETMNANLQTKIRRLEVRLASLEDQQ
jgi:hypothetical protein